MPRTRLSARRRRPKPYDHTQPRRCCIMRAASPCVMDHSVAEKLYTIVRLCDEIKALDDVDDDYQRMRRTFIHKSVICIQKLAECALTLNMECESSDHDA